MRKSPRLYYVPGMISLVVLPILLMIWAKPFKEQERMLELAFPTNNRPCHPEVIDGMRYDTSLLSLPFNRRHYIDIKMNGDVNKVKDQLLFFRYAIRHLQQSKDTINGLHVIFGDSTTYETYIACWNICLREEQWQFMPFRDNLWILYNKFNAESKEYARKQIAENRKWEIVMNSDSLKEFNLLDEILERRWPWLFCWLLLCILSFRLIWKRYR